jgi:hypothetical protein
MYRLARIRALAFAWKQEFFLIQTCKVWNHIKFPNYIFPSLFKGLFSSHTRYHVYLFKTSVLYVGPIPVRFLNLFLNLFSLHSPRDKKKIFVLKVLLWIILLILLFLSKVTSVVKRRFLKAAWWVSEGRWKLMRNAKSVNPSGFQKPVNIGTSDFSEQFRANISGFLNLFNPMDSSSRTPTAFSKIRQTSTGMFP